MLGVRFSFVATRSGLTRVRHFDADDLKIKKEALAFAKKHARAIDETFYQRTVDYNMLINDSATLIQVPFNTHQKIKDIFTLYELSQTYNYEGSSVEPTGSSDPSSMDADTTRLSLKDMSLREKLEGVLANNSLFAIASQSMIVNEGAQRAVAGVTGVFYDYASFVLRFFENTNSKIEGGKPIARPSHCFSEMSSDPSCDDSKRIKCGETNDTIDCLLIDNNGYILVSEELDYIGRHLKAYEPIILNKLVTEGVFHEVNITDYQSVCMKHEEKQPISSSNRISPFSQSPRGILFAILSNFSSILSHIWTLSLSLTGILIQAPQTEANHAQSAMTIKQLAALQPMLSLLPNKTYLRPCEKTLIRYETRVGSYGSNSPDYYKTRCACDAWFVYQQVPRTNLILVIVDSSTTCRQMCDAVSQQGDLEEQLDILPPEEETEARVCSMVERESQLYRKKLDACFSHHPEEEHIKICGAAARSVSINNLVIMIVISFSTKYLVSFSSQI